MKVIVDTNVLISAIFFSGTPSKILQAWREGKLELIITQEILDEYLKVSNELNQKYPEINIDSIIGIIISNAQFVQSDRLPKQICDDDDKFLECALSTREKLIISGDKHLLKVNGFRGIQILSPKDFVIRHLE